MTPEVERVIGYQLGGIVRTSLEPSEVDQTDGTVIYQRWSVGITEEWILRKKLTGTVWQTGSVYGLWANRAALTYTAIEMGG